MTCSDALHLVEAIAAGDLEVDDQVRAHFETCPRLRVRARLRPAARAGAPGAARSLRRRRASRRPSSGRIRHERWRSEERVDRVFNVAIVVAVLLVVGSVAALTNVDAVLGGAPIALGNARGRRRPGARGRGPGAPHLHRRRRPADVRPRHVVVGGSDDYRCRFRGSGFRRRTLNSELLNLNPQVANNPQIFPPLIEQHRDPTEQQPAHEKRDAAPGQHHDRRQRRQCERAVSSRGR